MTTGYFYIIWTTKMMFAPKLPPVGREISPFDSSHNYS